MAFNSFKIQNRKIEGPITNICLNTVGYAEKRRQSFILLVIDRQCIVILRAKCVYDNIRFVFFFLLIFLYGKKKTNEIAQVDITQSYIYGKALWNVNNILCRAGRKGNRGKLKAVRRRQKESRNKESIEKKMWYKIWKEKE